MTTAKEIEFNTHARFRGVRAARLLSSALVVLMMIFSPLAAGASFAAWYFLEGNPIFFLALSAILVGLSGAGALFFALGATYFPFRRPPRTVSEVLASGGNAADAATFSVIRLLGSFGSHPRPEKILDAFTTLLNSPDGQLLLRHLELPPGIVLPLVKTHVVPELSWPHLAESALKVATSMGESYLSVYHFLAVFLLHPSLRRDLRKLEYTEADIAFVVWWVIAARQLQHYRARWWAKEQLLDFTGIGLSWASGYTPFVDQFARLPSGNPWDLPLGHEAQVEELINALSRQRQSNVIVVGQPGSGRIGIVKEMARRVNTNRAHPALNGQRVMYIHLGQLLGIAGSGPEQMATVSRALTEMERAGNVIAILDGVSTVLGGGGASAGNLTDVVMPFFSSGTVRVVIIMSTDDYHLRFKGNADLLKLFEIVQVEPLTPEQTMKLLALTAEAWEKRTHIFLPYKTIRAIVRRTATILPEIPFPEKAFDVLEDALVITQKQAIHVLTETQVTDIISHKIGFNVGRLAAAEKSKLLNLESFIHKRVVNQEKGVAAVARAMIRARAGVSSGKRPIGSFLFLGPTGVGKTETSKALAEAYFGSEDYIQRLDMSEYQGPDAIGRLLGTPRQPSGRLTSLISDHPFSVLLLDEFEKADRNVHVLFLQVLDEGHISDVRGRRFSFNHAIIIATSNAGAEFIRQHVADDGRLPENFDAQLREHILRQDLFRPELLNRFDGVVTFMPLSKEHIYQVATLMLRKLNKRLDEQHGVTVAATADLLQFLVRIGYNPEFGARPMARAIQNTVEYAIAQKILKGEIEPGQEITLHSSTLEKIQIPS